MCDVLTTLKFPKLIFILQLLQDLKDYFRSAGEITYTNAHKPRVGEG